MAGLWRPSLFRGSRPWNSPIEYSSASTAAPSSFSRPASRSSSTTNSSRTTPNTASNARPNVVEGRSGCVRKRAPTAHCAVQKPLFHSSPRRAGRCFAVRAFKNSPRLRPSPSPERPRLSQHRTEEQVALCRRGESRNPRQGCQLGVMALAVDQGMRCDLAP